MKPMTMRDRILAVVKGHELDRVPFITYDFEPPLIREVRESVGRERIGLLRWSGVHRVAHPNCRREDEPFSVGDTRWLRTTIHAPAGSIYEERAYEPGYGSSSIRKHFVQEAEDYEVLWSYLQDAIVIEDYGRYHFDAADLGDDGLPLVALERTPYQQLWVEWVGLNTLPYHFADFADRVARTIDLLNAQARRIMEIAAASPAPFIDFPDNITAPAIGTRRFREYCVPLYDEMAEMLEGQSRPVFVHMDGDLRPLWGAIAESKLGGIDSLSPTPDNDTSVTEAVALWPEKRLWVNFPSSVHVRPYDQVRAIAEDILNAGGHTGRLQLQISENVPLDVWRTSFNAIADAVGAFGKP